MIALENIYKIKFIFLTLACFKHKLKKWQVKIKVILCCFDTDLTKFAVYTI